MKREIKFRVWDKKLNCWLDKEEIYFEQTSDGNFEYCQQKLDSYHGYEIQQYTGLKDKNGKEIYEGDVVKTVPEHMLYKIIDISEYDNGIIMYYRGYFGVSQSMIGFSFLSDFILESGNPIALEVIGNIFENPELLK